MAIAAVQPKIKLVLVDRQRVRHKVCVCALGCCTHMRASLDYCPHMCQTDTYIKRLGAEVDRVHCDIKDLCLSQVASLAGRSVVGVAKHLCGNGTDVSLRCMASGLLPTASSTQGGFAGMTFATCCHHRCNWRDFCGQEAFVKTMVMTWRGPSLLQWLKLTHDQDLLLLLVWRQGFTREDFEVVRALTSWTVTNSRGDPQYGGHAPAGGAGGGAGASSVATTANVHAASLSYVCVSKRGW